jgi:hypothetical protein
MRMLQNLKDKKVSNFTKVGLMVLAFVISGSISVGTMSQVDSIFYPDFTCVLGNQVMCP